MRNGPRLDELTQTSGLMECLSHYSRQDCRDVPNTLLRTDETVHQAWVRNYNNFQSSTDCTYDVKSITFFGGIFGFRPRLHSRGTKIIVPYHYSRLTAYIHYTFPSDPVSGLSVKNISFHTFAFIIYYNLFLIST